MGFRQNVDADFDEISDDVLEAVLMWRKDVRRRIQKGKLPKEMSQQDWFKDFINYVTEREL